MGSTGKYHLVVNRHRSTGSLDYFLDQNRGLPGDPKGYHSCQVGEGNFQAAAEVHRGSYPSSSTTTCSIHNILLENEISRYRPPLREVRSRAGED